MKRALANQMNSQLGGGFQIEPKMMGDESITMSKRGSIGG